MEHTVIGTRSVSPHLEARPMRVLHWLVLFICLAVYLESPASADMLIVGGRVWTANPKLPWAEAVAIRDDRVAFVGSSAQARQFPLHDPEIIELHGSLVLPGINEAHAHLLMGAESLERVNLEEFDSVTNVQAAIAEFASSQKDRPWVLGRGWMYSAFPGGLPTKEQLDVVVPDRPAYMEAYDGHTGWANTRALEIAGITSQTADPNDGVIVRDRLTGAPTGALKESANGLVTRHIPKLDDEQRYQLLLRSVALLNSLGITSLQDAAFSAPDDLPLLQRALQENRLTIRFRGAVVMNPETVDVTIGRVKELKCVLSGDLLRVDAVKAFVDGVIEAKTAAMLTPYPGTMNCGSANWEAEVLNAAVVAADAAGIQVWLHATGDGAVRMCLDAHEAAERANGPRDRRGRIEHIETMHPADFPRFHQLGVLASMMPLHANPNQNLLEVWSGNAGPDRASRGFPWRNLESSDAVLIFGSDWPIVTADPLRGLYCATTRTTPDGEPVGGWLPGQTVSLESALRHYTSDAAYASFDEAAKGSVEVGKLADLVILSDDIFRQSTAQLLRTRVVLTIVGGRTVFEDPGWKRAQ